MPDGQRTAPSGVLTNERKHLEQGNAGNHFGNLPNDIFGGPILMVWLIIFNIIIVILAICFGLIAWRAANAKKTAPTMESGKRPNSDSV
jgi:hypothetical protein